MIRPTTTLCMMAAFGSGLYLYAEKHRTAMLDREIGHVFRATEIAHERIGLLRAEWAVLNEPGRLEQLSDRYLSLHTMAPAQFVQLADLRNHLPAPMATAPAGSTDDDDATEPAQPVVADADANQAPPAAAHAEAAPAQHDAPKALAKLEQKPHVSRHVAVATAEPRDVIVPHGTPLPLAAPQPVAASYLSAMAHPIRQPQRAIVSAVPSYSTASPYVGSVLGGRSALPPPVPYSTANQ
jgi:hypothetical protein